VFRRQNRVVDRLDSRRRRHSATKASRRTRACCAPKRRWTDACRPLIDLVSAKAEGRKMDLLDKLEMPSAAPACDRAVKDLEALLPTAPTS
jgi:hypothetical protein